MLNLKWNVTFHAFNVLNGLVLGFFNGLTSNELKNFNGNGIFIYPLHIIIQYSAVLLPPPALISHCDQEKLCNNTIHTDILPWNSYDNICMVIPWFLWEDTEPEIQKCRNSKIIWLFFCLVLFPNCVALLPF